MHKIPELEKLNIKDITSYGGAMQHGEERAKKHDKAASLYNHVSPLIHPSASIVQHMGCIPGASLGLSCIGCCRWQWDVIEDHAL